MNVIRLFIKAAPGWVMLAAVLGLMAGGATAGLLFLTTRILRDGRSAGDAALFAGLAVWVLVSKVGMGAVLARTHQDVVMQLRRSLARQVMAQNLRQLEIAGAHRVWAALTEDVHVVSNAMLCTPGLVAQICVVAGCLFYLGTLSLSLLGVSVVLLGVGVLTYRIPLAYVFRQYGETRAVSDRLFQAFRDLTSGAKELKLSHARRAEFLSGQLDPVTAELRARNLRSQRWLELTFSWGRLFVFALIAFVLFGWSDGNLQVTTGYALTLLYLQAPMEALLGLLPEVGRASAAMDKLSALGLRMDPVVSTNDSQDKVPPPRPDSWTTLWLEDIRHRYTTEEDTFTLGPLNLQLRRGELVFVVGGNGSGKTTLAKILSGLYVPEAGQVRVDGVPLRDAERPGYRELFGAVFSDFHLFERTPPATSDVSAPRWTPDELLATFRLEQKVRLEDRQWSTLHLSTGQRKRLALICTLLEDRPILVLDEWAADQDPQFRDLYYRQILPSLRSRGKLLFVITHDERYFHLADRLLRLDAGALTEVPVPREAAKADVA